MFASCGGNGRRACLQYPADVVYLVTIESNTGATQVMSGVVAAPVRRPRRATLDTLWTGVCSGQLGAVP